MLSPKTSAFSVRFFVHAKQLFRCGRNYLSFSIQREMILSISSIRAARSSLSLANIPSSTNKFSLFHRDLYLILEGRGFFFHFWKMLVENKSTRGVQLWQFTQASFFLCYITEISWSVYLEHWRPGFSDFHPLFPSAISIFIDSPYFQSRKRYSSWFLHLLQSAWSRLLCKFTSSINPIFRGRLHWFYILTIVKQFLSSWAFHSLVYITVK